MRPQLHSPPMSLRSHISLLAALLIALVAVGCGSSGDEIPAEQAELLTQRLDDLQDQINAGDCTGADSTLNDLLIDVEALDGEVDRDIRRALRQLTDQLVSLFDAQCGDGTTTTTTDTTTDTTTTAPTTTETTTTDTTTETTTTTDPTTTTDTTTTAPPGGGGGSGGAGPGGDGG